MGNGSFIRGAGVGFVVVEDRVNSGVGRLFNTRVAGGALIDVWLNSIELADGLSSTSPKFCSRAASKFFLNLGAISLLDAVENKIKLEWKINMG